MYSGIILPDLVSQNRQEIHSHKHNQYIGPFPPRFRDIIIDGIFPILRMIIGSRRADQYGVILFGPVIVHTDPPISASVVAQIDGNYLPGSIELVCYDPGVSASALLDV